MNCKYCGSENLILKGKTDNLMTENQVALICANCGKWIKWMPKNERKIYLLNSSKNKIEKGELQNNQLSEFARQFLRKLNQSYENGQIEYSAYSELMGLILPILKTEEIK